jgi:nitrate/TMAO reductase-like tetraheme cytochrome c subunit
MKRVREMLKKFFFPSAGAPLWMRVLPYAILGILTIIVLTAGVSTWEYTNSSVFCGTTCHTMPPEYTAYLQSPHARIDCVDCHIGRDVLSVRVTRKAGDIKHVLATVFKTYEYPIRATDLRPAQDTCERCHFPEKFSDDSLRQIKSFSDDLANTPLTTFLVLKTGGGSKRQGLGLGIHWHIETDVYYLPLDPEQQQIPYVRVKEDDGTTTEYIDTESGIDPSTIDESKLVKMDCITCHNRITHLVNQPETSIDKLMSVGIISTSIPEIRKKAVEVLRTSYPTTQDAVTGINNLENYYSQNYADFYNQNQALVKNAVSAIRDLYTNSVFPEQKSDWNSHPDNIGHIYSPGCFRCHDGKHMSTTGKAVRLECNLCHSVPVVMPANKLVADIEISRGPEPESHLNQTWIALHNKVFDASCSACHTTEDAGGTSNTSFCSNSACHGNVFKYAGFDAPSLRQIILNQLPPTPTITPTVMPTETPVSSQKPTETVVSGLNPTATASATSSATITYDALIGPLLKERCSACHGENAMKGLDLTTYQTTMSGSVDGPVITPGDPENSLLIKMQSGNQPHFGQLTPEELALVKQWIEAGAPEK